MGMNNKFVRSARGVAAALVFMVAAIPAVGQPSLFCGQFSLSESNFSAGDQPFSVAIGDLNGDGILDLATANLFSDDVSVLLGNGNGTFRDEHRFGVGFEPLFVTVGDLNGDSIPDLVTANSGIFGGGGARDDVSILLGNGDGTFQPELRFDTHINPQSVAICDLNGDEIPDLAVPNRDRENVSVLLGNGDGTFQRDQRYGVGIDPVSVAIGDLDGDGAPDLAVANFDSDDVSLLFGNGDGTFEHEQRIAAGNGPSSIAIGDLDGMGGLDLAVSNFFSDDASVILGIGNGAFNSELRFDAGEEPDYVAIADLNGDALPDLAVANGFSGYVSVLLGNGDGTFQSEQRYSAGEIPEAIAIGDLNGDGVPDLAVANQSSDDVRVLLGNGDGTFKTEPQHFDVGSRPESIAIGDLDGDGTPDLATANNINNNVSVLLGNGDGTYQSEQRFGAGVAPQSVAIGDLDEDGHADLAVANAATDDVSVLLGNGDGTFQSDVRFGVGDTPFSIVIGDLDGDADPDLAVAYSNFGGGVSVRLGNGNGTFQAEQRTSTGNGPFGLVIGHLNGDTIPDLAVVNGGSEDVGVLLGVGNGTFQAEQRFGAGDAPQAISIGDLDGDGTNDLAVANISSNDVSILIGNGDGTFQGEARYGAGSGPDSVAIKDLDGDGTPDLAVANLFGDEMSVLLGNGDGTFQSARRFEAGNGPNSVVIGDLDGDGTCDIAASNGFSNDVNVWLNQTVSSTLFTGTSGGSSNLVDPDNWDGGVAPSIEAPFAAVFDASSASLLSIETLGLTGPASFRALALASGTIRLNLNGQSLDLLGFDAAEGPIGLELGVEQCGGPDLLPSSEPVFRFFNDDFFDGSVTTTRATIGALGPATLEIQDNATVRVLDALTFGGSGRGTVQIEDVDALLEYGDVSMQPPVPAARAVVGTRDLGLVDISDGGKVDGAAETLVLGKGFTGDGRIFVSGNGSRWKHTGDEVIIGDNGHGEIRVLNGGDFESLINDRIVLARGANASAAIEVRGAGSTWLNSGIGTVVIGGEGTATVTVEDNGVMVVPGLDNTANGTLIGDGTLLTNVVNYGDLVVGSTDPARGNTAGTMTIDGDYDQFDDPLNPEISGRVLIDAFESDGTVTTGMLSISGEANLRGGLIVTSDASLDPGAIASTPVLQAGSVNGRFDVAFLPGVLPDSQGDGRFLRVEYPVPVRSDDGAARGVVTVNLVVDTLENSIELESAEAFDVNGSPVAADVGDLNNDEFIDVALALPDETDPTIAPGDALVLFNAGNFGDIWQGFDSFVQFAAPPDPSDIAIGNIDASGGFDLAVSSRAINAARLYRNDGLGQPGSITVDQDIVISGPASSVVFGELDEDKWDDLIIANPENDTIEVVDNTLGGVFDPPVPVPVGASVSNVTASDLDGNGFDDVVTTNPGDGTLSVVLRNLDGTFQPAVDLPAVGTPGSVVLLDLDDDGDLDIAYTSDDGSGTNTVQVLRNDLTDGQVIFSPDAAISTGGNPVYLFSADVDSDGQEDLLTLNADSGARGAASFNDVSVVRQSAALCAGDCNNDGSVNFSDLVAMLGEFGTLGTNPGCDPDQSGTVDFSDLVMALGVFGACP